MLSKTTKRAGTGVIEVQLYLFQTSALDGASLRADTDFFFLVEGNNDLPLSVIELQIPGPVARSLVERETTRAIVTLAVKLFSCMGKAISMRTDNCV